MLIFQTLHIKYHSNAEPCRTGIWGWQIANVSKYLTKCGICCKPYIPMFITFSRKKGGKKAIYFILLRNQWCKKISLPPHPCFPVGILSSCSHYPHMSAETDLSPSSWDSSSRCMPKAEDITWGIVRYLCRDPSPAKMYLSTSFKQEVTREIIHPSTKAKQPLNGDVQSHLNECQFIRAGRQKQPANHVATSAAGKKDQLGKLLTSWRRLRKR